jgi:chemosensory pili system protein ChpA (sensor histidine kinase/response regulator)
VAGASNLLFLIKTEVDRSLDVVRDSIAAYSAASGDAAPLHGCPDQLHQVSGALRIVGLAGATRFCEAIEGAFPYLRRARQARAAVEVVDRAVLALKEFVDALTQGEPNVPLRLFPLYCELGALQGKPDSAESDLFFPDLALPTPVHASPRILSRDGFTPFLELQCARFQRGFLAWLGSQPEGLAEMRQAVDALHQVAPQLPEPQGLWWVAGGMMDALELEPDDSWIAATRALCHRIDFHMRDIAAGSQTSNEALLRDALFAVAKCRAATPRLREVKQHYQLDSLFPEPVLPDWEYDMDWLQPVLNDLRSRLEALKEVWQQYISGEHKSAEQFRELIASFNSKALELQNWHLIRLLDVIALVSKRLPDPYPQQGQFMVIEMASAFLLVESVIDNFTNPPADLEKHTVIMGGWLLDAAKGKSSGRPPAGLRADLSQKIGILQLRAQVAREILANLQYVEQVLDAFARDAAKRDTLPGLAPYLRQIHGALVVLEFDLGMEVASLCEAMIGNCARPDHPRTEEDLDWVAEGLSTLVLYLEPCVNGREPANEFIKLFFDRLQARAVLSDAHIEVQAEEAADVVQTAAPAAAVSAAEPAPERPADAPAAEAWSALAQESSAEPGAASGNEALLTIFLDEAAELLADIDAALLALRENLENRDALTTVRAGFHTMKGSGRMVGLTDFCEVAWQIEQVLNRWLEQQEPATPKLIELINAASASFSTWVAQLRTGKALEMDAGELVALAHALAAEEPAAAPAKAPAIDAAAAPAPEAPVASAPAPEPEEVEIDGIRLKRDFFDIYLREATQHVDTLDVEYGAWSDAPQGAEVSHELLRASHTLASSSRTAGFTEIAELAAAVEQWTAFARLTTRPDDTEQVARAIAELREMVTFVTLRQRPGRAGAVLGGLRELTARLQAAPPTLVEPRAPTSDPLATVGATPAAARPREQRGTNERRRMRDDIDEQLLPIFLQEAQDLLPMIGKDLREWKARPHDQAISRALRRDLHTLKGSARMAGAIRLGELTHIMESRAEAVTDAERSPIEVFEDLESKLDRLSVDLEHLLKARGRPAPAAPLIQEAPQAPPVEPIVPAARLRINADTLDRLINESGEISIARSRVEAATRVMKQSLADLSDGIARLRAQLREVEIQAESRMQSRASVADERDPEFDPLEFDRYTRLQELTRMMVESLHDATSIQQTLLKNVGEADAAVLHQTRISRDVQQELMRMRAVPFSNLNERLYRIVRQSARELGKKAELEIQGSQVELDRSVLDRIAAPLEHMLRNALAHGLEAPAARAAAGKPETGRIAIALQQEGNEIVLVLSDDGGGLDLAGLRRRAIDKELLRRDQEMSDAELAQLVFVSGLSTAEAVTELSGRGVGMDVVRNEISAIGGRIDIASVRGQGTTFSTYLPLTVAITQAVLVRAGTSVLAVSSAMVEQVLRLKADAMVGLYEAKKLEWQGRTYPVHYLAHLLGAAGSTEIQSYNSVLLLRSGVQRIALHVTQLMGNHEIVVKHIGPQLARVPGVAGATVLADGRIALIVNPVQLAQRARIAPVRPTAPEQAAIPPAAPTVMVVDDSLTVRKIVSRLLEREGYQVVTAKDGLDALEQMKEALPDLMLVDIEMPRMDGFDLTKTLRGDNRTVGIPIIIISSRTAEKHRARAAQLGIEAFLGKPYQDAELLKHVESYLGKRKNAPRYH